MLTLPPLTPICKITEYPIPGRHNPLFFSEPSETIIYTQEQLESYIKYTINLPNPPNFKIEWID